MKKLTITSLGLLFIPALVSAQTISPDASSLTDVAGALQEFINLLVPIAFTLGIVAFFWGMAVFIFNAGDEEARGKGKSIMIWGVVAIFLMTAIWGVVAFLGELFGIDVNQDIEVGQITPPTVNTK